MEIEKVHKTQRLYIEAEQSWFDVYEAPGIEGKAITATVPREEQTVNAVRRHLLKRGAELPPGAELKKNLADAIVQEAPVVRRAARTGWRDDNRRFVSHKHVAGDKEGGEVLPPNGASAALRGIASRGHLKGWQKLAKIARCSTAMTVALCAPFAAPLLAPMRRPSFGLNLYGPSRCGKSTTQLLSASVMGFGREEELPSLNATDSGLLAAALAFNDHMLPINEVGTAKGEKRDVYVALRNATYALMNGQDVLRHPAWTGADGMGHTFQVVCLLSSEHSPDIWAARHGELRDEGETARLIGFPVLGRRGSTVFDRAPEDLSGEHLKAWEKEQFDRLRDGLPLHCGVALPPFLDLLVNDSKALFHRARALSERFESQLITPAMKNVARDIVSKFGLLAAGGVIAANAGILPLERTEIWTAVGRACRAAIKAIPDPESDLRADLSLLSERLRSGGMIDLENSTRQKLRLMRDSDGFFAKRGKGTSYVVRSQVFVGWFRTPVRARRVLDWLDEEGFLEHQRARSVGRSLSWAQKQVTWPDESRPRSISLYLPRGPADLEEDNL